MKRIKITVEYHPDDLAYNVEVQGRLLSSDQIATALEAVAKRMRFDGRVLDRLPDGPSPTAEEWAERNAPPAPKRLEVSEHGPFQARLVEVGSPEGYPDVAAGSAVVRFVVSPDVAKAMGPFLYDFVGLQLIHGEIKDAAEGGA